MASDKCDYNPTDIPLGYRFQPTDEELLAYYLLKKVKGERIPWDIIGDCEIYGDKEPWKIFGETSSETFYVFTKQKKKGKGQKRIDRIAGSGTWKDQRKDHVKDSKGNILGFKRLLVFEVKGSDDSKQKGKGHWIMHEYSLPDDNQSCVLCTIRNKDGIGDDAEPPWKKMKTSYSVEEDRALPIAAAAEFEDVTAEEEHNIDGMNNLMESNQYFSTDLFDKSPRKMMETNGSVEDDRAASTVPAAMFEYVSKEEDTDEMNNWIPTMLNADIEHVSWMEVFLSTFPIQRMQNGHEEMIKEPGSWDREASNSNLHYSLP